ncbi:nucleoside 2-deoxyribosyltransferase domain-containing protein [Fluviicola sp.]|uniref:nucleoside 2-deoxyribosyltransferase domain-containing protein n=1 Tax=Fluviicola sp. TaxID=1917219 RepID=UPI002601C424|nr:nucleoside 2-deoxyribosyltransferase domain-containing protein [Fluviicola sp.]
MQIIKPPQSFNDPNQKFTVFLAGSIEMGIAEDWQTVVEQNLSSETDLCIFNPRRDDWDASWKQEKTNPAFHEQVSWEMDGLEKADLIVFYFSPQTKSPVSMLELGLFARTGKGVVCCPEGFWRKGNVDIVCERFEIPQVDTLNEMINYIKQKRHENKSANIN